MHELKPVCFNVNLLNRHHVAISNRHCISNKQYDNLIDVFIFINGLTGPLVSARLGTEHGNMKEIKF